MKRIALVAVLMFGLTTSARAGFDEGLAAFERGDYATALEEWLPLAEGGNANAQYHLGFMYAVGQGVPKDNIEAHMWLSLAAAKEDAVARMTRDKLAGLMTPADISESQRLAREWLEEHGE